MHTRHIQASVRSVHGPQDAANPPSGTCQHLGVAPVFSTITADDWRRELAIARATPNAISAQIRTIVEARQ